MATRYDVITPRENGERTFWLKIGSAWSSDKFVMAITLDASPLPDSKGQVKLFIAEPKAKDAPAPAQRSGGGRPADLDDSIPFGMEWR